MLKESFGLSSEDVVVVTGAASGIGRATARLAANLGLSVSGWDLDGEGAAAVLEEINADGGRGIALTVDVTDDDVVEAAFAETCSELGVPRYLVNNAGPKSTGDYEFRDALRMAAGSVQMVTEKWMALELPRPAALVNVSSVAGSLIGAAPDWYGSSKAAIAGYTRFLAITHAKWLRSNAVAPGAVNTPRMAPYMATEVGQAWADTNPTGRIAEPEEVASVICFLLSPAAGYVNGVLLPIDGGATLTL
jgi:NAD(P)-dependent dehydrogenase (short-subunit alcohol dehydrogenase family)